MDEPANENKPKPGTPVDRAVIPAKPDDAKAGAKLSPEEQMAAFEKAMKEEDWGHQPC